ncbi:uncharacterized protein [Littorina saxatilis]|uniref:RING-type domain-containing protein n=1 Tax=Littorina saxatilis TaxID=31220 RepID=A0AAN9BW21_9CAEN
MEGPVRCGEMLYGTARPCNMRQESNGIVTTSHKKRRKKKAAGRLINFFKQATSCCTKNRSSSPPECEEDEDCRLKTVQDHDKDSVAVTLVGKIGRYDPASYQHVRKRMERNIAKDTGLSLRDGDNISSAGGIEQTFSKQRMLNSGHHRSSCSSQRRSLRCYDCQVLGRCPDVHTGATSEASHVKTVEVLNHGISPACDSPAKDKESASVSSVEAQDEHNMSIQNKTEASVVSAPSDPGVFGSLVDDLKEGVHQISAEISRDVYPQRRGRTREKFMNPSSMKRSSLRSLYNFRHFHRYPVPRNIRMIDINNFCYPRFAELQARRNTLKDCTDPQLNGYEFEELARVGWYFNRRALVTFCCGMEMPVTPNGHPLDVHIGLSPQCGFAQSLQKPPVGALAREDQAEEQQGSPEASGGVSEIRFSVPVQATEDVIVGYGIFSGAYEGAEGFQGAFQESRPGEHRSIDGDSYALAGAAEPSGASAYMENLVTNTTPLASERFQPFSGNPDQARQRPTGTMQNTFETAGRLFMRGNVQDPVGSARLLRDLEGDNGRRSPPDLTPADQINMDGRLNNYRARYPQFGFPTVRNWTFEGWPRTHSQTPSMLADGGFFYAGYGDSVLCYSCGIGVRHWLPMDDPWVEHARWRPACMYVQTIQGQDFIDAAVELSRNNRHPTYQEVRLDANRRRRAAEAGNGEDAPAPAALPGDDMTGLLCKVCYEEEMNTVLMPCRHLAVCTRCSGRVGTCPICRAHIESTFRANFG